MKDKDEFFFRLSIALGFTLLVAFIYILTGCCSTASVEIVKEVSCVGLY